MRDFIVYFKGVPKDFCQVSCCSVECSTNQIGNPVLIFRTFDSQGFSVISLYLPVSMVERIEENIKNVHVLDDLLLERIP